MPSVAKKKTTPKKRTPPASALNGSMPTVKPSTATAAATPAAAGTSNAAGQARQARIPQAFTQIVAVLMRDPVYKSLTLAELEWLVLPPLMAGQYRVASATMQSAADKAPQAGMQVPVALALWARVSPELEARLSGNLQGTPRLRAAEWVCGDIPFLMVVAGHPRALPEFLKQLVEKEFKGKQVKMLMRRAGVKSGTAATAEPGPSTR